MDLDQNNLVTNVERLKNFITNTGKLLQKDMLLFYITKNLLSLEITNFIKFLNNISNVSQIYEEKWDTFHYYYSTLFFEYNNKKYKITEGICIDDMNMVDEIPTTVYIQENEKWVEYKNIYDDQILNCFYTFNNNFTNFRYESWRFNSMIDENYYD